MASGGGGGRGGGQQGSPTPGGSSRLAGTQAQVDEVVTIMRSNVNVLMERGSKLDDLDTRAEALNASAATFQRQSTAIQKKMWWRKVKWTIILAIVVIIVIIGIGVSIAQAVKSSSNNNNSGGGNDSGNASRALVVGGNATGSIQALLGAGNQSIIIVNGK